MFLTPRTNVGYRDALFEKLNLKTRVGLVMCAIKKRDITNLIQHTLLFHYLNFFLRFDRIPSAGNIANVINALPFQ